jgi:hypothetical protein
VWGEPLPRCKGVLAVRGEEQQVMVRGVQDTYDTYRPWCWGPQGGRAAGGWQGRAG